MGEKEAVIDEAFHDERAKVLDQVRLSSESNSVAGKVIDENFQDMIRRHEAELDGVNSNLDREREAKQARLKAKMDRRKNAKEKQLDTEIVEPKKKKKKKKKKNFLWFNTTA